MPSLAWGIIGTGNIAKAFARGLATSTTGHCLAVGSRAQQTADAFAAEFNLPRAYGSYEALLADPDVQAVYISTPHPQHAEWAIKAAEAGKHILCEKPLTLNVHEAEAVIDAARRHDVFLMEAFMYRCHPQTAKLAELIRNRAIGDVRIIQATFSFHAGFNPESRIYKNALGGGGILDVGCYCTSLARLVAGVANGGEIAEPISVAGAGHLGSTNVDEYAVAILTFPGDIIAQLATGVGLNQDNVVRISGSEGSIVIPSPWFASRDAGTCTIVLHRYRTAPEEILVESTAGLYTIEADTVAAHLGARQAPSPCMTWADTLGNMRTLDRWREAIGLVYEAEQPAAWTLPVDKRPLTVRPAAPIPRAHLPGIAKPVSRLIMGTMSPRNIAEASVLYDAFFAAGGTAWDSAYVYGGGGLSERLLGQWVRNRGIREQVVIMDKGAHTPCCDPENLTRQLLESLDRLGMDYLDLYMMHRDNLDIPVGEFIDVLNEHQRAGRIRAFGVSNWTIARIEAANAYASARGLAGIAAVSNNFSLARMVNPLWEGSLAASDPASRAWFTRTQMPLLPWSAQARGFFVRAHPDDHSDPSLVNAWYSEENFQRLARARQFAEARGVLPINLALAYVLHQPFPTFPMIGPATPGELHSTLAALEISLTPEECAWLDLETEPAAL